jgi:hypothetical protein
MKKRRVVLGVVVGVAAVAPVVTAHPAVAVDNAIPVAGNFTGDARDELFMYRAGSGLDELIELSKVSGEYFSDPHDPTAFSVSASYKPTAGDFDGDGYDEIFWLNASGQDYLWNFTSFDTMTSTAMTVNGTYTTAAGDFTGDGADDLLFYGPGGDPDYIWEFDVGGSHSSTAISVAGTYKPVTGSFIGSGSDEILWYAPGTSDDYMWTFTSGLSYTSSTTPAINGTNYQPNVLNTVPDNYDDVFWYAPGTGADILWNYTTSGITSTPPVPVNGTYASTAGDLFGDTHGDIFLFSECSVRFLDWHADAGTLTVHNEPFGANCLLGSEDYGKLMIPVLDE